MKYYIAADGGGTKIISLLYDENLNLIKSVKQYGSSIMSKSPAQTKAEIENALAELIPSYVTEIEGADLCIVNGADSYIDILKSRCHVHEVKKRGEGDVPIAASGAAFGIVAQAGTGSDAFLLQPKKITTVGGWGAVLGDEGGGYDIGLKTLKAAIYHHDGRGEKTLIHDILREEWNIKSEFYELVFKVAESSDYRNLIASATSITKKAASLGDKVALKIYEDAGHDLATQVLAVINKNGGTWEGPIITSGGAWKGCAVMRSSFDADIKAKYPDAEIIWPYFEPVIGSIIMRRYDIGDKFSDIKDKLFTNFKDFVFQKPE